MLSTLFEAKLAPFARKLVKLDRGFKEQEFIEFLQANRSMNDSHNKIP
jgi:hypothetical protein